MQVHIRDETGELTSLTIESDWRVVELKDAVQRRLGMEDVSSFELELGRCPLEDERVPLADIGLEPDTVLNMRLSSKEVAKRKLRNLGVSLSGKEVIRAAWECNAELLALLTTAGVDVNERGFGGWTALMSAAPSGNTEMIRLLAETGDLAHVSDNGLTALMLGAQTGQTEIVRCLVQAEADLTATDVYGNTALEIAVAHGHIETARIILDATPSHALAGLLNVAITSGQMQALDSLLELGIRDEGDMKALHTAAQVRNVNAAEIVLRYNTNVDVENSKGMTPLMVAVQAGSFRVTTFLLNRGASITKTDHNGWNALFFAAQYRMSDILPQLVTDDTVNHGDVAGWTPLHIAAQHGHICTAKYLLEHEANPLAKCRSGCYPKDIALQYGQEEVATLL